MDLRLPFPPKELNPNNKSKQHWGVTSRHTKKYRNDCCWLAKSTKKPDHFRLLITFCPPDDKKRDEDNMIASFKAGRDGLADAWGVDDYIFKFQYAFSAPEKHGAIYISCLEENL